MQTLWEVKIQYKGLLIVEHETLLILTATRSLKLATQKAVTFLRHNRGRYPKAVIDTVDFAGQIDA